MKIVNYLSVLPLCIFTSLHSAIANADTVAQSTTAIDYQSQVGRVLGVLLLLIAGIFAVVWVMKKIGYNGHIGPRLLSVKACLPLSNKDKLYIVQVGDEQMLIGVNAGGITPLKTLPKDDSTPTETDHENTFSKKLQALLTQKISNSEIQ